MGEGSSILDLLAGGLNKAEQIPILGDVLGIGRGLTAGPGYENLSGREQVIRTAMTGLMGFVAPQAIPGLFANFAEQNALTQAALQTPEFRKLQAEVGYKEAARRSGISGYSPSLFPQMEALETPGRISGTGPDGAVQEDELRQLYRGLRPPGTDVKLPEITQTPTGRSIAALPPLSTKAALAEAVGKRELLSEGITAQGIEGARTLPELKTLLKLPQTLADQRALQAEAEATRPNDLTTLENVTTTESGITVVRKQIPRAQQAWGSVEAAEAAISRPDARAMIPADKQYVITQHSDGTAGVEIADDPIKKARIAIRQAKAIAEIPSKLSSEQQREFGQMRATWESLNDLAVLYEDAKTKIPPGTIGQVLGVMKLDAPVGQAQGRISRFLGFAGLDSSERAEFRAAMAAIKNQMVYTLTGKQINEAEAARIARQVPSETDSVPEFEAKLKQTQDNLLRLEAGKYETAGRPLEARAVRALMHKATKAEAPAAAGADYLKLIEEQEKRRKAAR